MICFYDTQKLIERVKLLENFSLMMHLTKQFMSYEGRDYYGNKGIVSEEA